MQLDDDMIFVFGSNELGIHGGGAAKVAREQYGAILHQGFGLQGQSWGIPTCHLPVGQPGWELPFDTVAYYVRCFVEDAKRRSTQKFKITRIGCGLAGWKDEQIAPLFQPLVLGPSLLMNRNCWFDTKWQPWLGKFKMHAQYWGTV